MTQERPDDYPEPMTYDEIEEKWGREARLECENYWEMRAEEKRDPTAGLIYNPTEGELEHDEETEQTDVTDWTGDSDA